MAAARRLPATPPSALHAFYERSTLPAERALLDEASWNDLDLPAVFERMDRSVSLPGRLAFFRMLRTPCAAAAVLEERERVVSRLAPDRPLAVALAAELERLERSSSVEELVGLLWDAPPTLAAGWLYTL